MKLNKQLGFGLVEVMMAAGLMGGIALSVAKISQDANRATKTTETNVEINSFINDVSYILTDKDNCRATIPSGTDASNGALNGILRNTSTSPVYGIASSGKTYGNGTFSIESITTERPDPATNGVNLVFKINRLGKMNLSSKQIIKRIPLKAVVVNDKITDCFSDVEDMISQAVQLACDGNSAKYDPATGTCKHNTTAITCPNGQAVKEITLNDGQTVPVCQSVHASFSCSSGMYLQGVNPDGSLNCQPLNVSSAACGQGQYARALSNGTLSCIDIPRCVGNSLLRSDAAGELYCQNLPCNTANQYFAGFDGAGIPVCKNFPDRVCGDGQYIKEVRPDGTTVCGQVPNHVSLARSDFSFVDGFDAATNTWSRKDWPAIGERVCSMFPGYQWNGSSCLPPASADYVTWAQLNNTRSPAEGKRIHRSWLKEPFHTGWNGWALLGGDLTNSHKAICGTKAEIDYETVASVDYQRVLKVTAHVAVQTDDRTSADEMEAELRASTSTGWNSAIDYKRRLIWGEDDGQSWDPDVIILEGYTTQPAGAILYVRAYGTTLSGGCSRFGTNTHFVIQEL